METRLPWRPMRGSLTSRRTYAGGERTGVPGGAAEKAQGWVLTPALLGLFGEGQVHQQDGDGQEEEER